VIHKKQNIPNKSSNQKITYTSTGATLIKEDIWRIIACIKKNK